MKKDLDFPINSKTEDELNFKDYAVQILDEFLLDKENYAEGLTVGITGDWGSGKSSLLNLMKEDILRRDSSRIVIDFNPWHLANGDENSILKIFFSEIGTKFRLFKKRKVVYGIGTELFKYAKSLKITDAVPWLLAVRLALSAFLNFILRRLDNSLVSRRYNELYEHFSKLDKPIFLFVDDIDRLSREEILDLFKLVRQTAAFPNLIYILAYDSQLVAQALDAAGTPGHLYIQKIVQFEAPIQNLPFDELINLMFDLSFKELNDNSFSDKELRRWSAAKEPLEQSIYNYRTVKRISKSILLSKKSFPSLNIVDLIILETIKNVEPIMFDFLKKHYKLFTKHLVEFTRDGRKYAYHFEKIDSIVLNNSKYLVDIIYPGFVDFMDSPKNDEAYKKFMGSIRKHTNISEGHISSSHIAEKYFTKNSPIELINFDNAQKLISSMDSNNFNSIVETMDMSELANFFSEVVKITDLSHIAEERYVKNIFLTVVKRVEQLWAKSNIDHISYSQYNHSFVSFIRHLISNLPKEKQNTFINDLFYQFYFNKSFQALLILAVGSDRNWNSNGSLLKLETEDKLKTTLIDFKLEKQKSFANEWNFSYFLFFRKKWGANKLYIENLSIEHTKLLIRTASYQADMFKTRTYTIHWELLEEIFEPNCINLIIDKLQPVFSKPKDIEWLNMVIKSRDAFLSIRNNPIN